MSKVVLNIITAHKENQSATRVVPGGVGVGGVGESCFLIGGLNFSVLLPFYLVFRDCQPVFRTALTSLDFYHSIPSH